MVSGLYTRLSSKNAIVRRPSLTSQGTCRSPGRWVYNSCRCLTKARGLRHNTNISHTGAPNERTKLPLHYFCAVRDYYNWLNLPTPNGLKVPYRLLLRQPHRPSSWRHFNSNTMRLYRRPYSYDCPRFNVLSPLLPSKHQL